MNVINTNTLQLQVDVDSFFLLDQPSKLSDKHIR